MGPHRNDPVNALAEEAHRHGKVVSPVRVLVQLHHGRIRDEERVVRLLDRACEFLRPECSLVQANGAHDSLLIISPWMGLAAAACKGSKAKPAREVADSRSLALNAYSEVWTYDGPEWAGSLGSPTGVRRPIAGIREAGSRVTYACNSLWPEWRLLSVDWMPMHTYSFARLSSWLHQKPVRFRSTFHSSWFDTPGSPSNAPLCDQHEQNIYVAFGISIAGTPLEP